jgi:hypothetical protein
MTAKTELWDRLGKTDPKHTKGFKRAGGFSGTAIKPIYSYRKMTEEFGSCGEGWGVNEPTFQVLPGAEGEVLVYCTVSIWYGPAPVRVVYGVGGDKVITKFSSGLKSDDEAFKKAFTDAVTNALKLIGVGADVHMGLFEDNKYLSSVREEFSDAPKRQNPHVTRAEDVYDTSDTDIAPQSIDAETLSKAKAKALFAQLQEELWKCGSVEQLQAWNATNKPRFDLLPNDWFMMLKGVYKEHKDELTKLAKGDDVRMAG